ncbi:MAG TPA: tRNA (adenosine(37)-N6)-dimethylallyltransferase MiaA, partial [Dehalococcoidia bacterium]|nr:tRNA (adenosine(37)-N6)-dimethylallyltransferase MiaA [Dehalococcoidia bacterium]
VAGSTGVGKTALAVLAAGRLPLQVLSADSRQVYRHMDIGTAKPTAEERAAATHHLIDVVDPDEPFSLGTWLDMARAALEDVWNLGRQPILVGGTGQYVWALLEGWRVPRVPPDQALRDELESRPADDLLQELRRVDPEAEAFIDPRNVRRVIRALEVQAATGKPFSYWRTKEPPDFEPLILGLHVPRDELYRRIDVRVDAIFAAGFVDEVRRLLAMGYSRDLPSMSGIGYKEVAEHLAGERELASAIESTKTATHRLARHQHAWFKQTDDRIQWLAPGVSDQEARQAAESLLSAGVTQP